MATVHAHTPNDLGQWHELASHLRGTAELASTFAESFDGADFGRTIGLLHDVGKCGCTFAAYLMACVAEGDQIAKNRYPSRDHKTAGALLASRLDPRWGSFAAVPILGHHGGMPDFQDARGTLEMAEGDSSIAEALRQATLSLNQEILSPDLSVPAWLTSPPASRRGQLAHARDVEMFVRLGFSALVDADWLDTEAHFDPDRGQQRASGRPATGLLDRCQRYRRELTAQAPDTAVNQVRREIHRVLMETTAVEPGLYQLAAPTGAGKTLLGLEWSLAHAQHHGLRRLITAVPFISVTDQVAETYRNALEQSSETRPVVLEHHSQVATGGWWQRLAAENWDAPVVVTTTVRLFESLFSNRPSDCRRLHRLARSVIVLDEVQALPVELLDPIVDALRSLVERFGATVVLMTATQPALEWIPSSEGHGAVPLIERRPEWERVFARTDHRVRQGPLSVETLGMELRERDQFLCILNSIGDAERITRWLVSQGVGEVFHLSTRLRPADRRDRLAAIRDRLLAGQPCRVVSTQLVEAGVDLDLPAVYRAVGPLPSLVQADGRCNRNGLLPTKGQTVVFDLLDAKAPASAYYRVGIPLTKGLLASGAADAWAEEGIAEWYHRFLGDQMVLTDKHGIQQMRSVFKYRSVAELFKMIDEDTGSVVVPWNSPDPRAGRVDRVLARLAGGEPVGPADYRVLQDATVSLRTRQLHRAVGAGLAQTITPQLYRWLGEYDPLLGVQLSVPDQEDLIW